MTAKPPDKRYRLLASLLCLASACGWACSPHRHAPAFDVVQLQLEGTPSDDDEQEALREAILLRLAQSPEVHLVPRDRAQMARVGQAVVVRVQLTKAALRVALMPHEGFGPRYEALVPLRAFDHDDGPGATIGANEARAVDRAMAGAMAAVRLMVCAERRGLQALRSVVAAGAQATADGAYEAYNLQGFAIRRLAELQDHGAHAALRAVVLRGAQPEASPMQEALALQATGSLMALKDAGAVLPMISLAQNKEPAFVVQMAHAIGAVGGPMATAYLVTLASGHLDAEVRDAARTALAALEGPAGP